MDTLELFKILVKERGSDLIIKTNACPAMRVDGRIKYLSESRVPEAFARALLEEVLAPPQVRAFEAEGEADTSYEIEGVGRFRANVFRQRGRLALVFRHVLERIPSFKELNLPIRQLTELASLQRGLVLATGHYRNGVLLAPITGRLVADWVTGKGWHDSATALLPSRFLDAS